MKKRKICIISGSRADYSHMYWLIKECDQDKDINLQLLATGMHLSKRHGLSYQMIQQDGFKIGKKIDILRYSNTDEGVAHSVGLGCQLFTKAYKELKPDIVVIFADRFEMMAACLSAYMLKIPIVHLHGGETSQGALDEAIRHSITKMGSVHFTATEDYRRRVVQLGENPKRVFHVGSPGLESLSHQKYLSKSELAKKLKFDFDGQVALMTYHPVTLEKNTVTKHVGQLLKAIKATSLKVIMTKSNADAQGDVINKMLRDFCRDNPKRFKLYDYLGQFLYYNCLKSADVLIGNSSSGIVEAPSFKIPVVNVGDRQKGRVRSVNIIDVNNSTANILAGIKKALSKSFLTKLKGMNNPYQKYKDGRVAYRIKEKLKKIKLDDSILKKEFYDIKFQY